MRRTMVVQQRLTAIRDSTSYGSPSLARKSQADTSERPPKCRVPSSPPAGHSLADESAIYEGTAMPIASRRE